MTETILISVGCSLAVAIFYGFVIANKEDTIRNYLQNSATGFFRRIYVMALISAVRGRDKLSDSLNGYYLLVLSVFILSIYSHYYLEDLLSRHAKSVRWLSEYSGETIHKDEETIEERVEELQSSIEKMKDDLENVGTISKGLYIFSLAAIYLFIFIFRPYIIIRNRFSHEVGLYLNRIQGLAVKAELSEISVLESKVQDEESLKEFILCTKVVAKRHGVVELVGKFDLWEPNK